MVRATPDMTACKALACVNSRKEVAPNAVNGLGASILLSHQLGFPLPISVTSGIWNWEKLWKEFRLAAPATILKESLKGTGRLGMG